MCLFPARPVSFALARRGLVALLILVLAGSSAATAQDAAADDLPLPLTRVVLFSSSVGFFEHRGEVEGDRQIEFTFKTADINDLLKSLVVQDKSGGLVTAVNYGSPEPLSRTLKTLAVDLAENPSLASIFRQLRGQRVQLESPATVSGAIVGVESRSMSEAADAAPVEVLNVRTAEGLESVRIDRIVRTRFLDPKVDREFQQALDLLAQARTSDQKRVKLDFRGGGKRNVSVAYIQEAPVWKTSYRLVLADDAPPFLQGWAIVENTTTHDWQDVRLTLVSGRPISFQMDLYEPLFMPRPLVANERYASLRPRVYDQDLASRQQQFEQAAVKSSSAGRRSNMGGMGGMGGGMGGMGGMVGGMGGGMGGGAAPGQGQGRVFATADGEGRPDLNLAHGVQAAASGEDVGELFRYVIQAPVTLRRNESAMLPIVNQEIEGEKVAIYNPAVQAKHPLAGLKLKNTTDLHLLQGPITLFDGGEYAGDARIEDIAPGSSRLISYALDLETEIAVRNTSPKQTITALSIRRGGLHVKYKATQSAEYTIKNSSGKSKRILLERPIDPAWNVISPKAEETTRALRRFAITAEPGKPAKLAVMEEHDLHEDWLLSTLTPEQIEIYLRASAASPALKKALEETIKLMTKAAEFEADRAAAERRIAELANEQDRLRKNLQAVDPRDPFGQSIRKGASELLNRYLAKFAEVEDELERQRTRVQELKDAERQANAKIESYVQALVVE
jgi:hypothetical protein